MAKIINCLQDVCVLDMKDGEVAVQTRWIADNDEVGNVVQRYKNDLITIGKERGWSYPNLFVTPRDDSRIKQCRVRILTTGTNIEL